MDLAFRTASTPIFFEFIDTIGMIPAPSCLLARLDNVTRYSLNESTGSIFLVKESIENTDSRTFDIFAPFKEVHLLSLASEVNVTYESMCICRDRPCIEGTK